MKIRMFYLMLLSFLVSACGSSIPSENEARKALEAILPTEDDTRFLHLETFKKLDGAPLESEQFYLVDFEAELKCVIEEDGKRGSGCCYETSTYFPATGSSCDSRASDGERIVSKGQLTLVKKESGWGIQTQGRYWRVYKDWESSVVD